MKMIKETKGGQEDPYAMIHRLAVQLGHLVDSKQQQYGDAVGRSGMILRILYPQGVAMHRYDDVLLVVRVIDKLCRISERNEDGRDLGGESPWMDIAGYGLLGWLQDEEGEARTERMLARIEQLDHEVKRGG